MIKSWKGHVTKRKKNGRKRLARGSGQRLAEKEINGIKSDSVESTAASATILNAKNAVYSMCCISIDYIKQYEQ